jgi:uncharacterized lipoprotein YajG
MFCLSCGSDGLIRFSLAISAQVEVNAEKKRGSDEHHGNHHHEKVFSIGNGPIQMPSRDVLLQNHL